MSSTMNSYLLAPQQNWTKGSSRLNRRQLSGGIVSLAALTFAGSVEVAQAQPVQLVAVDVKTVGEGYQTTKLVGTKVQNDNEEKIGTLDDLVITKDRKLYSRAVCAVVRPNRY